MTGKPSNLGQFWQELKRRKVVRVAIVYAMVAYVIIELANNTFPALGIPDWALRLVIMLIIICFPIALIVSWIFDVTPEGIKKTESIEVVKEKEDEVKPAKRKLRVSDVIIAVLVVIVCILIYPKIFAKEKVVELEKSIAVLPFENMSDDSEFAHLGDAMTDEIIMQLYKINEFEVRSRTSIMQYKDTEKGSPLIGEELMVNYLLEGSTQRYKDQVRIRIQLIHASTDDHIWGDIFEGEWKDIFDIQINVAKQVARELKTVLSPEEIKQIEKNPTHSPEAYKLYLKARFFQNTRSEEGLAKAIEYYQEAIQLDPDYALAYSGLAHSYVLQNYYGYLPKHEILPKVKEIAARALEIDNKLGEAHFSLALVRGFEGDHVGAEEEYLLAIKLNPNNAEVHHRYSYVLSGMGKHDEAIREAKTAQELEPINPVMMRGLGWVYYFAHEYDLAIKECNKCLEIDPGQIFAYVILFCVYNQKEMYDDAIAALEKYFVVIEKEDIAALIRKTFEESGYIKAIRQLLDVSMEQSFGFVSNLYYKSVLFTLIGNKDKAFEWLEKTYEQREAWLDLLQVEPMYDSLRSDPRFQDLVERMNFPD